jgi:hypothetical protein
MKPKILVVCATHRDRRELGRLDDVAECAFHDYASLELELIAGTPSHVSGAIRDPDAEIRSLVAQARMLAVRGILSTDDYPGTALAAIVGSHLGLSAPTPRASLVAQHKYCARVVEAEVVPEATPAFALSSGERPALLDSGPVFTKPCKAFFSVGASAVLHPADWDEAKRVAALPPEFFDIFDRLCRDHAGIEVSARHLLVERLVEGAQCTVEGVRQKGRTWILGIVDSVYHPRGRSFARFEYPSSLPSAVQERMVDVTTRIIEAIGYDDGGFNVEMIWDAGRDRVFIIEVNPRSSSQFADLFEKVDGTNTYSFLLDVALGRAIAPPRRAGRYRHAASCVLRRFADARVDAVPTDVEVARILDADPDARIEVLVTAGKRLSDELQDGESYRYGIVNLGAQDRDELGARAASIQARLPFRFTERPHLRASRTIPRTTSASPSTRRPDSFSPNARTPASAVTTVVPARTTGLIAESPAPLRRRMK